LDIQQRLKIYNSDLNGAEAGVAAALLPTGVSNGEIGVTATSGNLKAESDTANVRMAGGVTRLPGTKSIPVHFDEITFIRGNRSCPSVYQCQVNTARLCHIQCKRLNNRGMEPDEWFHRY
jgi:hypothetical protein